MAGIGGIKLRLSELQELNIKAQKIRAKALKNSYKEANEVLHY